MTITVGTIVPYAGTSAPTGFLLCYGQAISRSTYAALFAVIGTTYGAGDGSTTFNVPDLRGRVVAGQDDMGGSSANRLTGQSGGVDGDGLGNAGGLETHTLVTAEMPAHSHRLWSTSGGGSGSSVAGFGSTSVSTACGLIPIGGTDAYYSTFNVGHAVMEDTGGGGAHNNVQPTLILNYIIATDNTAGNLGTGAVGITIDGQGQAISTGNKGYVYCPYAGTITAATLIADVSGSCVIDVWKAAYPTVPTVANTITASAKPTLSSAQVSQNTTLTGWTTSVSAGDVFGFNVDSASTVKRVTLTLTVQKS